MLHCDDCSSQSLLSEQHTVRRRAKYWGIEEGFDDIFRTTDHWSYLPPPHRLVSLEHPLYKARVTDVFILASSWEKDAPTWGIMSIPSLAER
jgi:hypothetical protein